MQSLLVLGSGSAGLLAALAIKRRVPEIKVTVVSSESLGIIGVGEGTVPFVLSFIHQYLGFDEADFYREVDPVYKLGVRFQWGKRDYFDYTFSTQQWAWQWPELGRPSGFFAEFGHHGIDLAGALMEGGKALPSRGQGFPDVPPPGNIVAWHLENHRFVEWLEKKAVELGVERLNGDLAEVNRGENGDLESLVLEDGRVLTADFFIDASGFRSELIEKVLGEPFEDYSDSLFCDRAVVGGWERKAGEKVRAYTGSDSMQAGWAWRIDHPERVNRGYVYASAHLTDDEAEREFREANPDLGPTRVVKFRSGRHRQMWVNNVVAIGNAGAFVEPLEATAIMCICLQSRWLADGLVDSQQRPTASMRSLYNRHALALWDEIREFLALHYHLNHRLESEFWKRCWHETKLGFSGELVEFYRENGPSKIGALYIPGESPFGVEGYYAMLVGMGAPMEKAGDPAFGRREGWLKRLRSFREVAAKGMTMEAARPLLRQASVWQAIRKG